MEPKEFEVVLHIGIGTYTFAGFRSVDEARTTVGYLLGLVERLRKDKQLPGGSLFYDINHVP